jgi:eukaryotic-like serine/threonine-protein kinase
MGEVYRAKDSRLGRDVAIKILPHAFALDPERVARFSREAHMLAALNHPHIAQIYGVEESGATRALVMELVDGETLADRIARERIAIDEALPIARQIAEALDAAHDAGIIHRDLKPANIKLRPNGTVKVLDFGLAKATEGAGEGGRHPLNSPTITSPAFTQAGIVLGTAAYMSPEQARGKSVDKRADIWAFGCVLYEMLTGRPAFPGDTITDVIAAVVKNEPDWTFLPTATPSSVRRTLIRCLRKDPEVRLRDIGDARLDLLERDDIDPVATTAPRRSLLAWITLTAIIALMAGAATATSWRSRQPSATTALRWTGVLVNGPATTMQPAVSPDGQLLAFQTIVDGQSQIAVMNPDVGTWRVLTSDRTRGLTVMHDWSPDGSRIFFDRQTDTLNGVFAVPSLGGDERLVLENAGYPVAFSNGDLLVQRVNAQRQSQLHRFSPSTGRIDPLPAVVDSGVSDDAVMASADDRRVYFFGQPLDKPTAPPAFYELDLETRRIEPVAPTLHLRAPVSMAPERGTSNILLGGLDGDAFQILRVSRSSAAPQALLTIPDAARFDIDARGNIYVGVRARSAELFAFPLADSSGRAPQRLSTLPTMNTREQQTLAPLPDGRMLAASRAGNRDRIQVMAAGRPPFALVDGEEETRPPATAIGTTHAAVMMGPRASPDIAIVNTTDGRLVRRFKAPSPGIGAMSASPDGRTLYYTTGGSVWSIPSEGGTPTKIGAGDSLTVDPERGDLIVKLDEGARMRLVRMKPSGGAVEEIPIRGDLRLTPRPLLSGAVRQGRLALAVASADSWFWHAAILDLKTGVVTKLAETNPSDFHFVTWRSDGVPIGFGYGLDTRLWKFTARPQ